MNHTNDYKNKYIKYKIKYLKLINNLNNNIQYKTTSIIKKPNTPTTFKSKSKPTLSIKQLNKKINPYKKLSRSSVPIKKKISQKKLSHPHSQKQLRKFSPIKKKISQTKLRKFSPIKKKQSQQQLRKFYPIKKKQSQKPLTSHISHNQIKSHQTQQISEPLHNHHPIQTSVTNVSPQAKTPQHEPRLTPLQAMQPLTTNLSLQDKTDRDHQPLTTNIFNNQIKPHQTQQISEPRHISPHATRKLDTNLSISAESQFNHRAMQPLGTNYPLQYKTERVQQHEPRRNHQRDMQTTSVTPVYPSQAKLLQIDEIYDSINFEESNLQLGINNDLEKYYMIEFYQDISGYICIKHNISIKEIFSNNIPECNNIKYTNSLLTKHIVNFNNIGLYFFKNTKNSNILNSYKRLIESPQSTNSQLYIQTFNRYYCCEYIVGTQSNKKYILFTSELYNNSDTFTINNVILLLLSIITMAVHNNIKVLVLYKIKFTKDIRNLMLANLLYSQCNELDIDIILFMNLVKISYSYLVKYIFKDMNVLKEMIIIIHNEKI